MRTHFLKDLDIPGREVLLKTFPEFDFYNLGRVKRLLVEAGDCTSEADFFLTASYRDSVSGKTADVTLKFRGVRQATLPELGPLFYLAEVEIEDLRSDQLEGIRYRTKDYRSQQFEVLSREIEISGF